MGSVFTSGTQTNSGGSTSVTLGVSRLVVPRVSVIPTTRSPSTPLTHRLADAAVW